MTRFYISPISALILIVLAVIFVYRPGLNGPFVFDDIVNIVNNPYIAVTEYSYSALWNAAFDSSEQFRRPLAFISFALNHLFAGNFTASFSFKLTNLLIHLINTILVYWLVTLLIRRLPNSDSLSSNQRAWLAVTVTAMWALHPLHLTSVLYVVQRMTSLAALFILAGLILFCYGRQRVKARRRWGFPLMTAGGLTGLVLGTACKENAVLVPLFMLLIEYFFFRNSAYTRPIKIRLAAFYIVAVAPLFLTWFWITFATDIIHESYVGREFTPWQRLLTESRVLWFYLSLLVFFDIRRFTLYHDDIALSTNLITPWTTLPALAALLIAVTLAVLFRKKYPVISFSIAWFLIGHSMESGIIGLEIAHEHRNYLPDIGPIFGVVHTVFKTFGRTARRTRIIRFLLTLSILVMGLATHLRAQIWSSESTLIEHMVSTHPFSARSHAIMGEFLAHRRNDRSGALKHYSKAAELSPQETSYLVKMAVVTCNTAVKQTENLTQEKNATTPWNLDVVYSNRIEDQLAALPPSPSTLASLRILSQRIIEPPNPCRHLSETALKWYGAALTNPFISGTVRSDIVTYFFTLSIWSGHYQQALETAKQERRRETENITYALMEAEAYIKLRQPGQAREILDSIAKSGTNPDKNAQANIAILRAMIQKMNIAK